MDALERMTPADLRAWQAHMGLTYTTAAQALGVSRAAYADWLAGRSRTTGKEITLPPMLGLTCAALAAGLQAWPGSEKGSDRASD